MKRETLQKFIERNNIRMTVQMNKSQDDLLEVVRNDFMNRFGNRIPPNANVKIIPISNNHNMSGNSELDKYYITISQGKAHTTIHRSFSYKPSPLEFFALIVISIRDETIPPKYAQQVKNILGSKEFMHLMENVDCNIKTTLQDTLESLGFKIDNDLYVFEKGYGKYYLNMTIASDDDIKFHINHIYVTLVDDKCEICVEDEQDLYGSLEEKIKMVKNFMDIYG